jgi:PAS domain S-box-containing protein
MIQLRQQQFYSRKLLFYASRPRRKNPSGAYPDGRFVLDILIFSCHRRQSTVSEASAISGGFHRARSDTPSLNQSRVTVLSAAVVVFVAYYLGAKIGFALTFKPHPVAVLWPPNSILLAALLLAPRRMWWILLLAALPAHWLTQLQSDVPPRMILCWFVSNCCEALVGATCIRYFIRRPVQLDRLYNVAIFCGAGAFLGSFFSSFLDAGFVLWNGWGSGTYFEIWRIRFVSNALAALTITPFILTWANGGLAGLRMKIKRLLEAELLLFLLITVSFIVFYYSRPNADPALLFLPLPVLLWSATRFASRGSATAVCLVSFLCIWAAAHGRGPFAEGSAEESALSVQVFLIVISITLMALAAVIEERDQTGEELREREILNRGVIDSLTSRVAILDRAGSIVATNESWRRAARSRSTLTSRIGVGANYLELCRRAARAGDRSAERVVTGIEAVLADTENHFRCEYDCATDNETLWFEMVVLPLRTKAGGVVIKHSDITRHKAIEKELRDRDEKINLAAESANLALWTINYERHESWMSDKGRELFGFEPNQRLSREVFLSRVHPDDREKVDEAIEQARAACQTFEIEYRLLLPDGETRWLISRGRYLSNDRGEASELIGVAIDVTVQVKADLELRLQREELARLNRVASMGELTASLAHELNQPLTAIASNAAAGKRFLASGDLSSFEELLGDVFADARRAGDVIHGIHNFVRKGEGTRTAVNVNDVIRDVLRLLHSDLLGRGITVESSLADDLAPVQADAVQLQQVLLNLIMNSLEAMQETPLPQRRLLISSQSSNGFVRVGIRDYGAGLPTDNPEKIFAHFFSTKPSGMGMGLTIARSIIAAHGGKLTAENIDEGAQFFFCLPAT